MKKVLLSILLTFLLCGQAFARNLNDPSILKLYARLNSNTSDYSGNIATAGTFTGENYNSTTPWGTNVANLDGTDDKIEFGAVFNGVKSISFWCEPATTSQQFIQLATGISVDVATGTIGTTGWTSPTVYVNGLVSSTLVAGVWQFVTVTSATAINANAVTVGLKGTDYGDTNIGEIRLYNTVLTGDEILSLYKMKYPKYPREQQPIDQIPDVSDATLTGAWLNRSTKLAQDLSSNNLDGTATAISTWETVGAKFSNATSVIDVGSDPVLTGADTFCAWIYPTGWGVGTIYGRIIENGKFALYMDDGADYIRFSSNGATYANAATNAIVLNRWSFICVTRTAAGVANIYVNGALSGTANQSSGTPANGTGNLLIGNLAAGNRAFDGKMKDVRLYSEVKSASWILREYQKGIPDDNLAVSTISGMKDLSKNNYSVYPSTDGQFLKAYNIGKNMWAPATGTSYVRLGSASAFSFTTQNFTIVGWFNSKAIGSAENMFYTGLTDVKGYLLTMGATGILVFKTNQASAHQSVISTNALTAFKWYHIVVTRNGSVGKIYLNGVECSYSTNEALVDPKTSTEVFHIGSINDGNNPWRYKVKDVRIYSDDAKSADWVKRDYDKTKIFY